MVRGTAGKLNINPDSVLEGVAQDVKAATGLGPELVTYYWQTFDAIVLAGKPGQGLRRAPVSGGHRRDSCDDPGVARHAGKFEPSRA